MPHCFKDIRFIFGKHRHKSFGRPRVKNIQRQLGNITQEEVIALCDHIKNDVIRFMKKKRPE